MALLLISAAARSRPSPTKTIIRTVTCSHRTPIVTTSVLEQQQQKRRRGVGVCPLNDVTCHRLLSNVSNTRYTPTTTSATINDVHERLGIGTKDEEAGQTPSPKDPLDLTFSDTKQAYKSKTTFELVRALVVLKLSSYDYLVNNSTKLIKLSRKLMGPPMFRYVMKQTFYGQFVAGEDEKDIEPVIQKLKSFGVKSILDYSAEEDLSEEEAVDITLSSTSDQVLDKAGISVSESAPDKDHHYHHMKSASGSASAIVEEILLPKDEEKSKELKKFQPQADFLDRRKYNPSARTYFYMNEASCERNMETFIKCIDAVANVTNVTGFAAIKLTALGRPQILLQLSEVIARTKLLFKEITGEDYMAMSKVSPEEFKSKYSARFEKITKSTSMNADIKNWFQSMDYDQRGLMNLFSWNGLVDMTHLVSDALKVPNLKSGKMESIISALSDDEDEMFRNMMRRIHHIASYAKDKDVRIMIDAEQTYFQPAINRITIELMRKYNVDKAIIFNTYQCYLKSAYDSVILDMELARRQSFYFGAKLVRGAYMDQERARAKKVGYEDPINENFEATTKMYHKILSHVMEEIIRSGIDNKKIGFMVASHNADTVRFTVEKMKELGIKPEHKVICFGQLYGMCDQISFPLGQSGYSVYKYVPYGPVDEVIPYLSRRGAENHGILQKVIWERQLLFKEIIRRFKNGELNHKPIGNYTPI